MNHVFDAEEYVYQALLKHQVIGLGEGGAGLLNAYQCIQKILMNQNVINSVDIIILNFLNAGYQDILDSFIFGDEINFDELNNLWRNSSQCLGLLGETNVYLEILKTIRNININLLPDQKIRVLAGDPPILWDKILTQKDYNEQLSFGELRHSFPVSLINEYAVIQKKNILLIDAEFHITKKADPNSLPTYATITERVNAIAPDLMKSIGMIYSSSLLNSINLSHLIKYSIFELMYNDVGEMSASIYWEQDDILQHGQMLSMYSQFKLKDIFDALVFLGPLRTLEWLHPNANHFSSKELAELNRRRKIFE